MLYVSLISFSSKDIAKIKFTLDRRTDVRIDRQTGRMIPINPQTSFAGGIITTVH